MSSLQAVTPETFEAEVLKSDKPVIVDFWAPWCQPCKQITPRIEKIAAETPEVKVVALNCEDHRDFARDLGVRSIPTLTTYKAGQKVDEVVGALVSVKLTQVFEAAKA